MTVPAWRCFRMAGPVPTYQYQTAAPLAFRLQCVALRIVVTDTNDLANDYCVSGKGRECQQTEEGEGFHAYYCTHFLTCVFWIISHQYPTCQVQIQLPLLRLLAIARRQRTTYRAGRNGVIGTGTAA